MHTPLDFMSLFYIHTEMSGEGTESGHKYEKELEFWLSSAHVTYTYAGTLPYARSMHTFLACKFLLEKD